MNGSIIKYLLIFFFLMLFLLLLCSILPSFNTVIGDLIATAATTTFVYIWMKWTIRTTITKLIITMENCVISILFSFFLFLIIFFNFFLSLVQFYCYYASLEVNNGLNKKKRICTILYTCFFHIHLKAIELCDIIFMSNCFL